MYVCKGYYFRKQIHAIYRKSSSFFGYRLKGRETGNQPSAFADEGVQPLHGYSDFIQDASSKEFSPLHYNALNPQFYPLKLQFELSVVGPL
jgi:hypothetical protein